MDFSFGKLRAPAVMGVVNVTPNSFSDAGAFLEKGKAVERARGMVRDGAQVLDLGAEASSFFRKGVEPVEAEEQWRRLRPVLEGLMGVQQFGGTRFWMSVDTRSAEVARRAVEMKAEIVNDISAGTFDERMLEVVAGSGAGIVLMHVAEGYPETPVEDEADIVGSVAEYLAGRVEAALRAGILKERIAVDPGIGFGKTMQDNWRLVAGCAAFNKLAASVVMGASRKRFLETEPVEEVREEFLAWRERVNEGGSGGVVGEHARDAASAAVTRMAWARGVGIHRVHDVALARRALAL